MLRIIKLILMGLTFLVLMLLTIITVSANAGGFTVTPNLPENQDEDTRGFFDLIVLAGQKQELSITVANVTSDELQLDFNVITATTASSGVINYGDPGDSDETLVYSFAEMAELSHKSIQIPGNTETEVKVTFSVPEDGFIGNILGSIVVVREPTQDEINDAGMIVNRHRQIIAVRLRMNDDVLEPDFKLGNISSALTNHRASIIAEIRNPVPALFRGVSATALIYREGNDSAIFEVSNPDITFAPNSIFSFSMVDRAGFGIQAGKYLAKIQLEYEGIRWEFEENFEILPDEAGEMNKAAVNQQQQSEITVDSDNLMNALLEFNILYVALIIFTLIVIIMATVTFIIIRRASIGRKKAYLEYTSKIDKLERENQLALERILSIQESKQHKIPIKKIKIKE